MSLIQFDSSRAPSIPESEKKSIISKIGEEILSITFGMLYHKMRAEGYYGDLDIQRNICNYIADGIVREEG